MSNKKSQTATFAAQSTATNSMYNAAMINHRNVVNLHSQASAHLETIQAQNSRAKQRLGAAVGGMAPAGVVYATAGNITNGSNSDVSHNVTGTASVAYSAYDPSNTMAPDFKSAANARNHTDVYVTPTNTCDSAQEYRAFPAVNMPNNGSDSQY